MQSLLVSIFPFGPHRTAAGALSGLRLPVVLVGWFLIIPLTIGAISLFRLDPSQWQQSACALLWLVIITSHLLGSV